MYLWYKSFSGSILQNKSFKAFPDKNCYLLTLKIGQPKNICFTDKLVLQYWHFGALSPFNKKLKEYLFLGDLDLWQHIYGIDHIYGRESGLRKSIVNSQRRRLLQTPGLVQRSPPPEAAEPRADRTPHPEYMWLQSAPTRQWALQSSHLYTQNWIIEQRGRTHTLSGVQAKLIKNTYQDQSLIVYHDNLLLYNWLQTFKVI